MSQLSSRRTLIIWILTIVITLGSVVYQRLTGPSYPIRGTVNIGEEVVKFKLLRSHDTSAKVKMEFEAVNRQITGEMRWRRFKSYDEWTIDKLLREGDKLIAIIPIQPPAGKVIYQISLIDENNTKYDLTREPVIIRFKGVVPTTVLIPHIIFMFIAMLLATRSGLEAFVRGEKAYRFTLWTSCMLILGGFIFGPIVQKYAFGSYWTGWPFGHDLTDSKTAGVMIFWIVALWRGRNHPDGRAWIIIAAIIQLLIYLIPHSTLGSELDYTKMN